MSAIKLVLLGVLRHLITALGAWLVAKGYLGADSQDAFVSRGVDEAFGALLILGSNVWSAMDKQKVIGWIRHALHLPVQNEKTAAEKISPLITSPGKTAVPFVLLVVGLSAFSSCAALGSKLTIYRSPERARTVLTATQTLRFRSAELVAKACIQERLTKERCDAYARADDSFRDAWEKASGLLQTWTATGSAPLGFQRAMGDVETIAGRLELDARKVE